MRAACVWLSTFSSLIPPQVRKYCIYCIYCNGYLYLYMYILYLLRWEDIAFYFWSKVEEIEFHGLLGVGHIQRHHFRRLSMVFISDHPWLIIYNVLSIHGWSKVKPVKNDDVIHEQPLTGIIIFYLSKVEEKGWYFKISGCWCCWSCCVFWRAENDIFDLVAVVKRVRCHVNK